MRKTVLVLLGAFLVLALSSSCGKKEEKTNEEDPQMRLENENAGDAEVAG